MSLKCLEESDMIDRKDQILTDTFGRDHNYLRISLTDKCNLRCFYCMPEEGVQLQPKESYMSADEVVNIAKLFVELGIKKIRLTGGEPLVRKDAAEIIERLSALPVDVGLTTNAVLVDRFIPLFKEVGMKKINVSLDSLDKDKNRMIVKRDHFDKIMLNINKLQAEGIDPKMNVVLMNGVNDDEVIDFVEWTKDTALNIRFIEFMPFNGNQWSLDKCVPDEVVLEKLRLHFGADQIEALDLPKHHISREYKIKGYKGRFGLISTVTKPFCAGCDRLRLTADGRLKNCLLGSDEVDLLTSYRRGEDIIPLIEQSVKAKKKMRGGMDDMEDAVQELAKENRSMIRIGG